MQVKLVTESGHFVKGDEIPLFASQPRVILWGDRVFVRNQDYDDITTGGGSISGYMEIFSYSLIG